MNPDIPIVIIHIGYQDYLKYNLEITGINNKIYLIGDNSIQHLEKINNVSFVNISKYKHLQPIINSKNKFINYSSNSKDFEWICFERVFILKYFLLDFNLSKVFHIDSDNILLGNINNYKFQKEIAYCCNKNYNQYRMSYSIHCALLNLNFCNKFIELYQDIYINKSKLYLIEDKINYHLDKNTNRFINGGICDMTLYYLLVEHNLLDVQNLLKPNQNIVFINNINNGEGFNSKEQYFTLNNILKINLEPNLITVNDKINNISYKLFNIHFQGSSKNLLNQNFKNVITKILKI